LLLITTKEHLMRERERKRERSERGVREEKEEEERRRRRKKKEEEEEEKRKKKGGGGGGGVKTRQDKYRREWPFALVGAAGGLRLGPGKVLTWRSCP
jgi:hypothetical protein